MNRWNTDFKNEQLFFRVMPGAKSVHFNDCYEKGYIGVNFGVDVDLSNDLPENWREFNKKYIPIYSIPTYTSEYIDIFPTTRLITIREL